MANKILSIILTLTIGTSSLLNAKNEYKKEYNNSTIKMSLSKNGKIFIREYIYNASDTDSKVSSRKKAITQLKSILSEEVGVHIQSSFSVKKTSHNKYVKKEINQLSASITKLKILEEKWNGSTYYIKASVKINEKQTMKLILEAIKKKSSQKDIKRLNKILKEQNGNLDKSYIKIKKLQKKLVLQEIKNQASKSELLYNKNILQKLLKEKQKYDYKINKQRSEINIIKNIIKKSESNAYNNLISGMTPLEVKKMIGEPRSIDSCSTRSYFKYGRLWVIFRSGILAGWIKLDEWDGACHSYKGIASAKERRFPNG